MKILFYFVGYLIGQIIGLSIYFIIDNIKRRKEFSEINQLCLKYAKEKYPEYFLDIM